MRVMTQIGEASAMVDGTEYLVRPSFAALAEIGDPEVLDDYVRQVCSAYEILLQDKMPTVSMLGCCANILDVCSDLPSEWLGCYTENRKFKQGKVRIDELVIMAHHCIKWGVQGDSKWKSKPSKKQYENRMFDPADFVSILIDEFHMSSSDAWNCTMTEFQRLCEQRQRKAWGHKPPPPSQDEVRDTMKAAREAIKRGNELGIKPENRATRGRK